MKKNKKGFTLIELLAVIVVLGVIMSIAGTAVLKQKKKANQGEIDSLYNTIKGFGADVYLSGKKDSACYSDTWLKENGLNSLPANVHFVNEIPQSELGELNLQLKNS